MAEDRNEFNAIVSVLGDVLVEVQALRKENNENFDRMIKTFNTGFTAITDKLTGIESEIKDFRKEYTASLADHEQRLKRIEEILFKR